MNVHSIAIQVRGLSKSFGNRVVLSRIDLDVAEGECVALIGANGAGKTTLLRCLAGALRPSAGEVRWCGRASAADPSARRLIGVVAHESLLYPHLTLRENLLFAARMYGVRGPAQRADQLLQRAGLQPHAHRLAAAISKGMRQRLAVLRAIIHEPPILLLDEPFSGLDAQGSEWLVELLDGQRDGGRTVCLVTHDEQMLHRVADRTTRLQSGRLQEVAIGRAPLPAEDYPSVWAA